MESGLIWNISHDEWKKHRAIGALVHEMTDNKTPVARVHEIAAAALAYLDQHEYWPVRQALAFCRHTSESTIRDFFARHEWYLDLGLVNNASCPRDILEHFADLPIKVCGANKGYGGYDQNKELRGIARKRLGLPEFEYPKEFKSLYQDLNEYTKS